MDEKHYKSLIRKARTYARAYYELDMPLVPDDEYDAIYNALVRFEEENPDMIDEKSPTQFAGWKK